MIRLLCLRNAHWLVYAVGKQTPFALTLFEYIGLNIGFWWCELVTVRNAGVLAECVAATDVAGGIIGDNPVISCDCRFGQR